MMKARNFPPMRKEDEMIFIKLEKEGEEFYKKFKKKNKEKKDKEPSKK